LSKKIKVYWFHQQVATPFVPFAVTQLKCAAGIMITASHNPKDDNGYKLYWSNGAQIIPPIDSDIQASIYNNLKVWKDVLNVNLEDNESLLVGIGDSIPKLYFEQIQRLSQKISCKENITYTAMHGVGTKWIDLACEAFKIPTFIKVKQQVEPDPDFPTVTLPNPEEGKGALKLAIECAENNNSKVILANDPDADRLAIAEKTKHGEWKIFNGNEIALLLADWVFSNYKGDKKVAMIASTVSSKVLSSMAKMEGFRFEDTLTGFKWIGNKAFDLSKEGYEILLAYEVEIGFLVSDISFDKGSLLKMLILQMELEQL
jgi:phosphomannomutase